MPPEQVAYVETSGCSVAKAEVQEVKALVEVIGSHRQSPLLIGSVMSNVGHMETASGMSMVEVTVVPVMNCSVVLLCVYT